MTPVFDIQSPLELIKKGKAAEAIPMLEFISKQMPSHVSCHVLLAQAYAEEERWQEALSSWQNASFLMPNSPAIRKGFREVLNILSRQTIKLIATAPEPVIEDIEPDNASELDTSDIETGDALDVEPENSEVEKKGDYTPKNIFSRSIPPPLAHLAPDESAIGEDVELDDLIHELESARIVPKPEHEIIETPVLEADIDDMVSETLARIYEGQKQYDEAARVYEKLAVMQPDRASDFEKRASELRSRSVNETD